MTNSRPNRVPTDDLYPSQLPPEVMDIWEAAQDAAGLVEEIALLRVVLALLVRDPAANHQHVCRVLSVLIRALQIGARDGTASERELLEVADTVLSDKEKE